MFTKKQRCLHQSLLMCIIFLLWGIPFSVPVLAANARGSKPENPSQANQSGPPLIRASEMIDQTVYNEQGEEIGDLDDFIMSRNGKIKKVILSVGEFLQAEQKRIAVPFKSLKIDERGRIFYNATKEQLNHEPSFSYWTEGLQGRPFDPFPPYGVGWGYQAPSPAFGGKSVSFPQGRKCPDEFRPWEWEYSPKRLRVSALLDEGILNNKGEEVADLDDLMINPEGEVKQIVLDAGGFSGMAEKLVAVPYRPLKVTDLGIIYNITKEQIEKSRAFSDEKREIDAGASR